MKNIKKVFFFLFAFAIVFTSCIIEPTPEMANYTGSSDEYVYYWTENGRNRDLEKTIVEFANTYLKKHPKLSNSEFKVITNLITEETVFSNKYYDESVRNKFIDDINLLIPKIGELEDSEVVFEMSRLIASLKDAHSWVSVDSKLYPLELEAIYNDDSVAFYAVSLPVDYEEAIYAKLTSINGVSVEEITKTGAEYISSENCYYTNKMFEDYLRDETFLKNLKIVEKESETAEFIFTKDDGTKISCVLSALDIENYYTLEMSKTLFSQKDTLMYKNNFNFWYEFIDEKTLYIRIQGFYTNDYSSLLKIVNELNKKVTLESQVSKTIVDVRNNNGGQKVPGYNDFVEMLKKEEFGNIYVLINDNSFSMAVALPSILKQNIKNLTLVGSPTGESPNVFGVVTSDYSEFSSSGVYFQIGEYIVTTWPDYEYDALMPDITIYQTIEDYKNGIDTVLEAVLAIE